LKLPGGAGIDSGLHVLNLLDVTSGQSNSTSGSIAVAHGTCPTGGADVRPVGNESVPNADTIDTVLVAWAGHFQF